MEVLEFEKVYSEDPVRQFINRYVMLSVAKKVKEVILTNNSTITRNGDNNTEFPKVWEAGQQSHIRNGLTVGYTVNESENTVLLFTVFLYLLCNLLILYSTYIPRHLVVIFIFASFCL